MGLPPLTTWRKRRVLTPFGWLTLTGIGLILIVTCLLTLYPFLALNRPVHGDILVVEGWLPDASLLKAADLFRGKITG